MDRRFVYAIALGGLVHVTGAFAIGPTRATLRQGIGRLRIPAPTEIDLDAIAASESPATAVTEVAQNTVNSAASETRPELGVARPTAHVSSNHIEELVAPAGSSSTTEVATGPSVGPSPSSSASTVVADRRSVLDRFDPNAKPSWMPTTKVIMPVDNRSESEKLAAKVSRDLAEGSDQKRNAITGGSAGPVVSAAHDAGIGYAAPETGYAMITVRTDGKGTVTGVFVVSSGGDRAAWDGVAADMKKRLAQKQLDVPSGADGVAVTVKVEARITLPSGSESANPTAGVGATDFGPGVSGHFDVADIGAKATRKVAVTIVSQSRL